MFDISPLWDEIEEKIEEEKKVTTPSESLKKVLKEATRELSKTTKEIAKSLGFPVVDAISVGSATRETFLPQNPELDIFVTLDTRKKEVLEKFAEMVGRELARKLSVNSMTKYAENPYIFFEMKKENVKLLVDIVASVHIESPEELIEVLPLGGMARTPFHAKYLRNRLKESEKDIPSEIRLFKHWLQRKKAYGTNGITGYLSELLVLHFKGFKEILVAAAKGEISELYLTAEGSQDKTLKEEFLQDKIIVIDPVDPQRNAAGGIQGLMGEIKLRRIFTEACRSLEIPSSMFQELLPREGVYFCIHFQKSSRNEDEHYQRLAKIAISVAKRLEREQYILRDIFIYPKTSKVVLILNEYEKDELIVKGPPVHLLESCEAFRGKHSQVFIEGSRLYARKKAKYPSVLEFVSHFKQNGVKFQNLELILP